MEGEGNLRDFVGDRDLFIASCWPKCKLQIICVLEKMLLVGTNIGREVACCFPARQCETIGHVNSIRIGSTSSLEDIEVTKTSK